MSTLPHIAVAIAWAFGVPTLNAGGYMASPAYDGLHDVQVTVLVQDTCPGVQPEDLARRFETAIFERGQDVYPWAEAPPGETTAFAEVALYCIPIDAERYVYSHQVTVSRIVGTPARRVLLATVDYQQVLRLVSRLRLPYVAGEDLERMADVVAAELAAANQKPTRKV